MEQVLTPDSINVTHLVDPCSDLGYSRIYLDFLAGKSSATRFYLAGSLEEVADQLDSRDYPRQQMVGILRKQNSRYNASAETFVNIDKLADPRAVCVVSGQQAGLLGGPLLTLLKALAVVKAARHYSEQLDRPVIPVFWIAGDDHDFEEANHTFLLDRQGGIKRIAYEAAPEPPVPVSSVQFSDQAELERLLGEVKEILGQSDFTPDLYDLLERAYSSKDTFVTAFGQFLAGLTQDLGLVLFSPGDPEAKQLATPLFEQFIKRQDQMHDELVSTNKEISAAGYHIQVEKSDDSSHLFCDLNGRLPIRRVDGGFAVGDLTFSSDELIARLKSSPDLFSPDVMTRPVLQSYLFPVLSQKGGPAEIAYLAQLNPLFDLFDLPAPAHKARPSMTILETRIKGHMDEMEIAYKDLCGDIEQVINRVLSRTFPENLEHDLNQLRESIAEQYHRFADEALVFDPGLKEFSKHKFGKIDFALKEFEAKVWSAHKKKSKDTRNRIYRIGASLYPDRTMQERVLNISYFVSRYGTGVIKYIYDHLDSEQTSHQMLSMENFT